MAVIAVILNTAVVLWLCRIILNRKVLVLPMRKHAIRTYESFKKSNEVLESLNMRYRVQTHLHEKITFKDMGIVVWGWLGLSLVIAWNLPVYAGLKIICFLGLSLIPLILLEWRIERIEHSIDQSLFSFLSLMNATLLKTEDFLQSLIDMETTFENPYMLSNIKTFNHSIKAGISPELAFNRLTEGVSHEYLKYVYLNIEQTYEKNGDVMELMQALENEYTSIQIEFNKRKIELRHDRNLTLFSLLIVLFTAFRIAKSNDYITSFYTSTEMGRRLGVILALGLFAGVVMVLFASKKKL